MSDLPPIKAVKLWAKATRRNGRIDVIGLGRLLALFVESDRRKGENDPKHGLLLGGADGDGGTAAAATARVDSSKFNGGAAADGADAEIPDRSDHGNQAAPAWRARL